MAKRKRVQQTQRKATPTATRRRSVPSVPSDPDDKRIIKYEFDARWRSKQKPTWHPIKKMRYVFWRMMSGITITDAIREIRWNEMEYWNLIDLKRHGPFREEYNRAKTLQGRSLADSVQIISEGRDRITRLQSKKTKRIVARSMRKIQKTKSVVGRKLLLAQLLDDLRERDKMMITRNRLQIDAAKWIAAKVNPSEYADRSGLSLSGALSGGADSVPRPIAIQFVGPDGKVVAL